VRHGQAILARSPIRSAHEEISRTSSPGATYRNVCCARKFERAVGRKANSWKKLGVDFPHRGTQGFNRELHP
jgi:hypothetical protein